VCVEANSQKLQSILCNPTACLLFTIPL